MTPLQTLALSASLLVNAMLILWLMYHARRIDTAQRTADDAYATAVDAVQRAIIANRLIQSRRVEIDELAKEIE